MSDIYATEESPTTIVVSEEIQVQRTEKFDRRSWNMFTLRAWKDDSIPNGELEVLSPIGRGRFGEVCGIFLKILKLGLSKFDEKSVQMPDMLSSKMTFLRYSGFCREGPVINYCTLL